MKKLLLFSGSLVLVCVLLARAQEKPVSESFDCGRIVTFAPSITEILFELDLGAAVVGVTRYDRYPADVLKLARLGGLLDPNLEALMLLRPSLAVLLREHGELEDNIRALGVRTLRLNHDSVSSILESFRTLGAACGRAPQAEVLVKRLETAIAEVRQQSTGRRRWRVLVVVGSNGGGELKNLFVSGKDGFFSELLEIAGGENVYQSSTSGLMGLSTEGLLQLNPQIILNIASSEGELKLDRQAFRRLWNDFPQIEAVKEDRIYVLDSDYMSVPGPRLNRALYDIQSVLRRAGEE